MLILEYDGLDIVNQSDGYSNSQIYLVSFISYAGYLMNIIKETPVDSIEDLVTSLSIAAEHVREILASLEFFSIHFIDAAKIILLLV